MAKYRQTPADLERHLAEHVGFLMRSAESFDQGYVSEAKRMAMSLRVLLHNTESSTSLLSQLNHGGLQFLDSASLDVTGNLLAFGGLVGIAVGGPSPRLIAPLDGDDPSRFKHLAFDEWWNAAVFRDQQRRTISRKQIVLALANKDGGGHVDPELSDAYASLSRRDGLGVLSGPAFDSEPLLESELFAVRQITHEVLRTLDANYRKRPNVPNEAVINVRMTFTPNVSSQPNPFPAVGRNDQCPCGSGKKYKKCHGASPAQEKSP